MAASGALWLAGCGTPPAPPPPTATASPAASPASPRPQPAPGTAARPALPPPVRARDWDDFKRHAALRIVAANPGRTYDGAVPEPLLAIPVLEVELGADGDVRHVRVMRHPTQARDTTQMAIDAVKRAGPFGPVAHLPRPWKFVEVFLFDDDRRFKPRTLDE
jgi:protein TonB